MIPVLSLFAENLRRAGLGFEGNLEGGSTYSKEQVLKVPKKLNKMSRTCHVPKIVSLPESLYLFIAIALEEQSLENDIIERANLIKLFILE